MALPPHLSRLDALLDLMVDDAVERLRRGEVLGGSRPASTNGPAQPVDRTAVSQVGAAKEAP